MRAPKSYAGPLPGDWLANLVQNVSAAGSTQGGATAIPAGQDATIVTTTGSGAGVVLPPSGVSIPETYTVANHGANPLLVYPAVGGKIGTAATNAGYSLAAGSSVTFMYIGNLQWCVGV